MRRTVSPRYLTVNSRWPRTASHKTPNLAAVGEDCPISAAVFLRFMSLQIADYGYRRPHVSVPHFRPPG